MSTGRERRRRPRTPRATLSGIRLLFQEKQGLRQTVPAQLIDLSEHGCGLELEADLPVNMPVTIVGDLTNQGGGREMQVNGRVSWCDPLSDWNWRAGIEFESPLPAGWDQKAKPKEERRALEDGSDYYELLQLSPNADLETIQRVFRILAARVHPDNLETGNADLFRQVHEAYKTLSDPALRAAYDAQYQQQKKLRWKIFEQPGSAHGMHAERAKRQGILSLLYRKRVASPEHPGVSILEIEDLLGVPREHLDFSLWFLRESGFVSRTDQGRLSITLRGVVEAEEAYLGVEPEHREDRLLEPARPEPTYA
jgi:curved DNA-binding protein